MNKHIDLSKLYLPNVRHDLFYLILFCGSRLIGWGFPGALNLGYVKKLAIQFNFSFERVG